MIKRVLPVLCLLSAVAAVFAPVPVSAKTDFNVNVNLGPPPVVVEAQPRIFFQEPPPEMVIIPRSTVYFAPGVNVDLFFHNDWWWTRNNGRWYRSREPRGSWVFVDPPRVPREIIRVRPDYRNYYERERHVPYGQLRNNWRERDVERREHRGEWRDYKEDKRDRKQHEKEMKRERKEDRRDDRGDRGHGHD